MKDKVLVAIKNIFCVLTVFWSLLMLFEYTIILIGVPQISGILYEVFDFCVLFLYFQCIFNTFSMNEILANGFKNFRFRNRRKIPIVCLRQ